ncbi:MAG TPA: hypothetical protein VF163_01465 [Micromonosporaceae bacterium]
MLAPITDADVGAVAQFLHTDLNPRVSAAAWARAMTVPWHVAAPNHGFFLAEGGDVVGAYLAFYSERSIDGRTVPFCNLAAWCVRPAYRFHSIKLLKALLAQPGYHFTDLSPSGNVLGLNTRLGFQFLDTTTALVPNLPWPSWPGTPRMSTEPAEFERVLTGRSRQVYADHAGTAAANHVLLRRGEQWCYVVFRKDRRKNLPLFASLLYVSDADLLRRWWRPFARHLLLRHGVAATLAELRIVTHRPRPSLLLRSPRRKMFKSPDLRPDQIDYLYSELACVAW